MTERLLKARDTIKNAALGLVATTQADEQPFPPQPRTCGQCVFWHRAEMKAFKTSYAAPCRRFPPVALGGFPAMLNHAWCGEYRSI